MPTALIDQVENDVGQDFIAAYRQADRFRETLEANALPVYMPLAHAALSAAVGPAADMMHPDAGAPGAGDDRMMTKALNIYTNAARNMARQLAKPRFGG